MMMSSLAARAPSSALRRTMYRPAAENVAEVFRWPASANVTLPGPETRVHVVLRPAVKPSSLTMPRRTAAVKSETPWFSPASTVGAVLVGVMPPGRGLLESAPPGNQEDGGI